MICGAIQNLIEYGIKNELITSDDVYVIRNQFMEALHLTNWTEEKSENTTDEDIDELLSPLIEYACQNHIIPDTINSKDLFDTKLMGILTPMPREVRAEFNRHYRNSPEEAMNWYYNFSKKLNYVRAGRITRDIKWTYKSEYGILDITINRSKPEKDPRDIAKARNLTASSYPKCQLCPENAGFSGNFNHPARQNLRPVPIKVNGQNWQIQYSPYGYYNEHCIIFNTEHIPMKIDSAIFEKLFDVLDFLPHYFVGSNADLPIVGGSILGHEHFQGGNYKFAMEKASIEKNFIIKKFPSVNAGIVKWPMSVIRLKSSNRNNLSEACVYILKTWKTYSDSNAGIYAETDGIQHNTITPIARMNSSCYECDLVLRNNLTTREYPLGVFHPNPSLHHIKKENIGLIEVMGLAVLPSRLAEELEILCELMISGADLSENSKTASHAEWAEAILLKHPEFSAENSKEILRNEVGAVFEQVLSDAGVFKRDKKGKQAFQKFISVLTGE